ncbi:extensin-like [Cervus elaphus]|uniref:extensin-like n=1 Tax=Cervus elaphus TaxID=9860 RepID=UPI001CC2AB86|nr:extensin-like [Cervus elaphus]
MRPTPRFPCRDAPHPAPPPRHPHGTLVPIPRIYLLFFLPPPGKHPSKGPPHSPIRAISPRTPGPYPHPRGPLPSPRHPSAHSSARLLLTAFAPQAAHPTHPPRPCDTPTDLGPHIYRQDPSGSPYTRSPSPRHRLPKNPSRPPPSVSVSPRTPLPPGLAGSGGGGGRSPGRDTPTRPPSCFPSFPPSFPPSLPPALAPR